MVAQAIGRPAVPEKARMGKSFVANSREKCIIFFMLDRLVVG
jgi:hypothetical protein